MTQKQKLETEILDILNSNKEIAQLAGYLIRAGAGTILPGDHIGDKKLSTPDEQLIAWELAEALAEPRAGEWETEIGKWVTEKDLKKMHEMAQQLHMQNPSCPFCHTGSRVIFHKRKKDYLCRHCKRTWIL